MRHLPLHRLNDFGWFRPSPWLYLCLLLLCRTWLLFIGAISSGESGSDLLALFYPNRSAFYLGLAIGIPALLLLWLQGLRHRLAWIGPIWRQGYWLLVTSLLLDLVLQLYQFWQHHGQFVLGPALVLLLSLWSLWYLLKSRSCRLLFSHQGELLDQ
ncbi:DUF2919 family protein [Ferrimonas senticii]|uniref:DUF2919 family protein n=1 Tax=Ferrimonas senticii TaxID=394566 RepID=UPI0003F7A028|nr:DUF2919 family protein [Ferrimonas senticii]